MVQRTGRVGPPTPNAVPIQRTSLMARLSNMPTLFLFHNTDAGDRWGIKVTVLQEGGAELHSRLPLLP